jgi:hypothetical protein
MRYKSVFMGLVVCYMGKDGKWKIENENQD